MHAAAETGDLDSLARLIQSDIAVNSRDERGRTPLMAATHGNQPEAFRMLLEVGADVDLQDDLQDNPFLYAGAEGLLEILVLANEAGADPTLTNRYGGVAIIPASERGHVEIVRYLLEETEIDVNHVNRLGWTALMEAVVLSDGGPRHQEIVRLLLAHGANPTIADFDGVTPLTHARNRGFDLIAQMLAQAESTRPLDS